MFKQKVHSGLALLLVWAVGLGFATAIILQADNNDVRFLISSEKGSAAAVETANQ